MGFFGIVIFLVPVLYLKEMNIKRVTKDPKKEEQVRVKFSVEFDAHSSFSTVKCC